MVVLSRLFQSVPAFHTMARPLPGVIPGPTCPVAEVMGTVHVAPTSEEICSVTLSTEESESAKSYVISTNLVPARCTPTTFDTTGAVWLCAGLAVNAKSSTMANAWIVVISLIWGVVTLKGINKKLELAETTSLICHCRLNLDASGC